MTQTTPIASAIHDGKRVLVIDDDQDLVRMLVTFFKNQGLEARGAHNTQEAKKELSRWRFDALIVDNMMPGETGLEFIAHLRAGGDRTPVLMLTAKAEENDRIEGLTTGADDFISKPFSARELFARLVSIWRRALMQQQSPANPQTGKKALIGTFTLDFSTRQLIKSTGEPQDLSSGEFAMLKAFSLNPGVALSRDRLMALCDEKDREAFDRAVDVRIARLRKLLEEMGGSGKWIQTVRGQGYIYVPPNDRPEDL